MLDVRQRTNGFLARINLVSRRLRSEAQRRLARHGVHSGQEFILGCLWERDGLTPSEIATRISVEAPTVTRAVRRMTDAGLVRVDADREDGRRVRVWLTRKGETLRRAVPEVTRNLEADALALLSEDERIQLLDMLDRIERALTPRPGRTEL
ncbi:MarR family winged helix-turn-helix transcriptional regulator [Saccharomonospora glauca]|jgi:DNA-binding MarR family transcriptional regulator|uniref:Transcriptional regulator n=1 Tax=Saccharomonospora glauca K62 TaxID=928724 RepID=I1D265_9PSEU|nr:MarR family transcriptional regulator [Saccharomonospora glauca]EIE99039.1 transcriptional regulator [Saccharomonospora glauca K62]